MTTTLSQNFKTNQRLRRTIMRRVWYAYTLSIVLRPALALGFVFGASAIAFWRLVSISSIIENILRVQVGQLPHYTVDALSQADIAALVAFIGLAFVATTVMVRMVRGLLEVHHPYTIAR